MGAPHPRQCMGGGSPESQAPSSVTSNVSPASAWAAESLNLQLGHAVVALPLKDDLCAVSLVSAH